MGARVEHAPTGRAVRAGFCTTQTSAAGRVELPQGNGGIAGRGGFPRSLAGRAGTLREEIGDSKISSLQISFLQISFLQSSSGARAALPGRLAGGALLHTAALLLRREQRLDQGQQRVPSLSGD
ncbi:MAG: hypothetical protein RIS76_4665 [Verrucomicrobiota bacterium]